MTDQGDLEAEVARLREENDELRRAADHPEPDPEAAARRTRRRRRVGSIVLAVVAGLLLPLGAMTLWTRNIVLNTDRYTETVTPLASDPAVQAAIIDRATEAINKEANFDELATDLLPERAQPLAGLIAGGAESLTRRVVTTVVESDQFAELWVEANRAGHDSIVAVLTGQGNEVADTENGRVVLNFGPLAEQVLRQIDTVTGLNLAKTIPAERINFRYVLVDSPDLARLQSQVRLFDRLAWWTVVLALVALVGAALVAEDRRLGLRRVAIAITASMAVLLLAYAGGRQLYLNNLPDTVQSVAAAEATFDTVTRFLHQTLRTLFTLGVVLLVVAWLAGPSGAAVRVRSWWNALIGRAGSADVPLGPVPGFVHTHRTALTTGVVVAAAAVLVIWNRPTGKVVIGLAVVTVVVVGLLQAIGASARGREPGPAT